MRIQKQRNARLVTSSAPRQQCAGSRFGISSQLFVLTTHRRSSPSNECLSCWACTRRSAHGPCQRSSDDKNGHRQQRSALFKFANCEPWFLVALAKKFDCLALAMTAVQRLHGSQGWIFQHLKPCFAGQSALRKYEGLAQIRPLIEACFRCRR